MAWTVTTLSLTFCNDLIEYILLKLTEGYASDLSFVKEWNIKLHMFNYEYCMIYGILCINILIPASGSACWSSLHCHIYNL